MSTMDASLHLLDRQVIDVDGRLVGKVDDLELTEEDGALVVTGLLLGLGALLPRFGRRLGPWLNSRYAQISVSHAARRVPAVIDLDVVDRVESGVHLRVAREGLLRPRVQGIGGPVRHRLGALLDLPVRAASGQIEPGRRPRVLDVRLDHRPGESERCEVAALLVGAGRPGALLGYDRGRVGAPAPVAGLVAWLHRHSRLVDWGPGVEVDWERGEVTVTAAAETRPLRPTS
ncbi:PRC-barrel domain-containing protein [Nocardioides daejeonensis]|uniref:PRC-barrel domain-containing protein n=1 Tax=Nocardioides daejeonensis TaxID=1046556 RepID=UPI000D743D7F|nr:hypothetical protein [Nocardioides daejeonensis]